MEMQDIRGGQFHSTFLLKNGEVYSCGQNTDGQLGIGEVPSTSTKRQEARAKLEAMPKEDVTPLQWVLLENNVSTP